MNEVQPAGDTKSSSSVPYTHSGIQAAKTLCSSMPGYPRFQYPEEGGEASRAHGKFYGSGLEVMYIIFAPLSPVRTSYPVIPNCKRYWEI